METLFYRKPRLLVLCLSLILVAGLSSFAVLPRLEDPEIRQRWALVLTPFPGANSERVEALVTERIEDELLELPEVDRLLTDSRRGLSVIRVFLKEDFNAVDEAWTKIRDELSDLRPFLPRQAADPELRTKGMRANTLIAALRWNSQAPVSYGLLRRLGEELRRDLQAVPGTQFTLLSGAPKESIQIELNTLKMKSLGLDASHIARTLRAHDAKVAAGLLRNSKQNLLVEVSGEFQSLSRLEAIPVQIGRSAQTVTLGELATIRRGIQSPPSELAFVDGAEGIAVSARMQPDKRVDLWAERARAKLEEFKQRIPPGMELTVLFDQSLYTQNRLSDLISNLLLGALLVAAVVFFTMGWKSALLVSLSLPLSSLMVLKGMHLLGVPMHQMSVTGLIIALGLLIDNAIVIVDEVTARKRSGLTMLEAIANAVSHLAVPLLGSTLTTVLAFMPLVLMPGGAGEFVGTIAVTVILALISSLFLALTVIPALTGLVFGDDAQVKEGFLNRGFQSERLASWYRSFLDTLFARPILGILLGVAVPILGFVQARTLKEQFFPPADRNQFQIQMRLPTQSSLEQTRELVLEATKVIQSESAVTNVHWFVGGNSPMFYYNMTNGQDNSPYYAQALVQLTSHLKSRDTIHRLQGKLNNAFPKAQALVLQLEQGPPFEAPIELRIFGSDLNELKELGEKARAILAGISDVTHSRMTLGDGDPKLHIALDEDRVRLVGLSPVEVAQQLDANLEGLIAGSILEATEELPITVRFRDQARSQAQSIASMELTVPNAQGGRSRVPLSSLGHLELRSEFSSVPHYSGRRCNTVQAYIKAGVLPQSVFEEFQRRLDKDFRPGLSPGIRLDFGGEAGERDKAVGNLMASVSVLLVMMLATLVLSFNSFRMAGILGAVAFLSIGLGLFALWLFQHPFGFMAIVGTMGLVGVAINDAIVVLAAIREDAVARTGDKVAVRNVVEHCTRHVLSTTLTTIFGFLPLLLSGGGFWPPLAIAIAGGVFGATLLALTFVPSAYFLVMCRDCPVQEALASLTPELSEGPAVVESAAVVGAVAVAVDG